MTTGGAQYCFHVDKPSGDILFECSGILKIFPDLSLLIQISKSFNNRHTCNILIQYEANSHQFFTRVVPQPYYNIVALLAKYPHFCLAFPSMKIGPCQ
jgi:hypothetical protein